MPVADLIIVEVVIIVDGQLLQLPELQVCLLRSLGRPTFPPRRPLSPAPLSLLYHVNLDRTAVWLQSDLSHHHRHNININTSV